MGRILDASYLASDRFDIALKHAFEFVIYGFGSDSGGVNQDLVLAVQECTLPTVGNEVIEIADGNGVVKVLGGRTVKGGSMTLRDFVDPDVEKRCLEWHDRANPRSESGKRYSRGKISEYKYDGVIYQYHAGDIVRKWNVYGVILTELNFGTLSKEDRSAIKTIEATLEYDDAERADKE